MTRALRAAALSAAASLIVVCSASAADPVYYSLPSNVAAGGGIAAAPNGDIWFGAGSPYDGSTPVTAIARLRPSEAAPGTANGIASFPTPIPQVPTPGCCANRVTSVAFDATKDRVWFVQNDGVVGNGNPATMVPNETTGMQATRLAGRQTLYDVAIARDGDAAWVTENSADNGVNWYGNRLAFVSSGLTVSEFDNLAKQSPSGDVDSLRYDAKPAGVTIDASGSPWFAEADPGNPGYRLGRGLTGGGPRGVGGYEEFQVQPCGSGNPCSGSYTGTGITDVAVAPDGSKWFTNQLKNQVGRFDGSTFTSYSLPAIDSGLAGGLALAITAAPDGTLWAIESGGYSKPTANAVIRIDPSNPVAPTATVYHLGNGHQPFAIAPDSAGNVWFATSDSSSQLIGELPGVIAGGSGAGGGGSSSSSGGGTTTTGTTTPSGTTPVATPATPGAPGPKPVVLTPSTVARARVDPPATDKGSVLADQICAAYDGAGNCKVVYIISAGEYVNAFPGAKVRAVAAKRAKAVVLAKTTVTTKPGTRKKVRIKLNAKGRKLLKSKKRLTVFFTAEQAGVGGKPAKILRRARLTLKR